MAALLIQRQLAGGDRYCKPLRVPQGDRQSMGFVALLAKYSSNNGATTAE